MKAQSLTARLLFGFLLIGTLPLVVLSVVTSRTMTSLGDELTESLRTSAVSGMQKIDRNLFERYGDVQAFGINQAVFDHNQWYRVGSQTNNLAATINGYVALYGFYPLSMVLDLEGKVAAVNDRDASGKPVDTAWLYGRNFKDAPWFQAAMAGRFLKSSTLDGTAVEDVSVDENLKRVTGGTGLTVTFTAPVKDPAGKLVGVWHNCADFSLVEEILRDGHADLVDRGLSAAEMTLLDARGRILASYGAAPGGGQARLERDPSVILKKNLAEAGVESARVAVSGKSGHQHDRHPGTQEPTVVGYAHSQGALGFPGLGWNLLIQVPQDQALDHLVTARRATLWVVGLSLAAVAVVGVLVGRSISRPIIHHLDHMETLAGGVAAASTQIATASNVLAQGASDQAASLEESGAALEQIASMTKRSTENARNALAISTKASGAATDGESSLRAMTGTLQQIRGAVENMQSAVKEIENSGGEVAKIIKTIDEIAFQTNILALNAAVEAARAGDAGLGFAVVADEVRNLAHRSAQAAQETTQRIDDSIRKSATGVAASERVVQGIGEIVTQASHVEKGFQLIIEQTRQVNAVMGEIAQAAQEQSAGIDQVNQAVSRVDKVVQSTAASAEQTASAAEQLKAQAKSQSDAIAAVGTLIKGAGGAASPASPAVSQDHSPDHAPAAPVTPRTRPTPAGRGPSPAPASGPGRGAAAASPVTAPGKTAAPAVEGAFRDF